MSEMIYLDNSATSFPKPDAVYDFMNSFYRRCGVNPGRSGFDAAIEAEELVMDTRKILTRLFNAGSDINRLTFSYNASDSLNMIIQGLVEEGDHVITTMLEHNSVLRPLYHLHVEKHVEVTHLPFDAHGYVDPDDVRKALRKNTKLVIVNHCSNVIGTIQPVAEIGHICKGADVIFAVDTTQTAGAVPIDMERMGIDVVVFTGHKCLLGPTGIGGSYVRESAPVKYTRFGGTGVRSAQLTHLDEYPYHLECGTLNLLGVAGLHAGVKWICEQGMDNLHRKEMALWDKLRTGIRNIENVVTYCAETAENHNPVLSFNIRNFDAADVGTMLDVDHNIACRTGLQCAPRVHEGLGTDTTHGTVRLSIGPFNTEEHIDRTIEAVRDIAGFKR